MQDAMMVRCRLVEVMVVNRDKIGIALSKGCCSFG
jgi:hypothetical protein